MSGFLLDTNTVSELVSVRPNQRVVDWLEASEESRLYLSVMTLGEIRQGVAALPQSKKRTALETWLEVDLQSRFAGRVLPVDGAVADRWGWLMAESQGKGTTPAGCGLPARGYRSSPQPHRGHSQCKRFCRDWPECRQSVGRDMSSPKTSTTESPG